MVYSSNTSQKSEFSEVSVFLQERRKTSKIMDICLTKFIAPFPIKNVISESDRY